MEPTEETAFPDYSACFTVFSIDIGSRHIAIDYALSYPLDNNTNGIQIIQAQCVAS
jgi:hypothetical protein